MEKRAFISRFSPNRTDPKILDAIFVQRHRLAEIWLDKLRDSILTGAKHHLLAVGPRGCGKSHLLNLLVYRLQKEVAIRDKVRIAKLPEDEINTSFWKFLQRILRALGGEYPTEFPPPPREKLEGISDDRRANFLVEYLLQKLDGRTLLVVVENLDEVMRGLKAEGQKRWRAFFQERGVAATLASSQQLTEDLSAREKPFFGFFQVEHLKPLSADEAQALLRRISEHSENRELAKFLDSPTGRARVRAVRHITGGNHRVFIILSESITWESLDSLVVAFEELLDELTPYYQERLRWLPDQQREMVEFLCRQTRTVAVKELAAELYHSEQTAAAQLKSLRDKGYVISETVGREARYELSEPLMRLCVEIKESQREPIRLIVEFLRIWYDRDQLESLYRKLSVNAELERRYYRAAIDRSRPSLPSPIEEALDRDLAEARKLNDPEEVVKVLVEQAGTSVSAAKLVDIGYELGGLRRFDEALSASERAIELDPIYASAWHNKGWNLGQLGRHQEALAAYERAVELDPKNSGSIGNLGWELVELNRPEEGLKAFERGVELNPKDATIWFNIGWALGELGRHDEELVAYERVNELDPKDADPWFNKAWVLNKRGRYKEAWVASDRGIELKAESPYGWENRARAKLGLGDIDEAKRDFLKALELNDNHSGAYEGLAEIAVVRGEWAEVERILFDRFRLPQSKSNPPKSQHLDDLIVAIFRTSGDAGSQRSRVTRLARIAAETEVVPMLGDSLVRSLTKPAYANAFEETRNGWVAAWQEAAKQYTDLSFAVRLFTVGMRYVQTQDERVLFDLLQEERAILRDLFKLDRGTKEK